MDKMKDEVQNYLIGFPFPPEHCWIPSEQLWMYAIKQRLCTVNIQLHSGVWCPDIQTYKSIGPKFLTIKSNLIQNWLTKTTATLYTDRNFFLNAEILHSHMIVFPQLLKHVTSFNPSKSSGSRCREYPVWVQVEKQVICFMTSAWVTQQIESLNLDGSSVELVSLQHLRVSCRRYKLRLF